MSKSFLIFQMMILCLVTAPIDTQIGGNGNG
jgi:hypothetical protein